MAYPGQQWGHHGHHQQQGEGGGWNIPAGGYNAPSYGGGQPQGGWGPPQGPPPGQSPGWGPPPGGSGGSGGWGPPQGPPPSQSPGWGPPPASSPGWGPPSGAPQPMQSYNSGGSGGWAPPTGPPPPTSDHTRPYPGVQGGQRPPQNYQQAQSFGGPPGAHFQPPQPGQNEPYFQYSNCTGRRKALCIGINYVGSSSELRGCHNDAVNMQRFLTERYGYKQEDIVVLMDVPSANHRQIPTRANITEAMRWLVAGAQPNDSLFFHYSGHGGQAADKDGDEADGYDETILPLDFKTAGEMIDDEMFAIMVAPLPAGCRLTAVFDSCHSGTALDLPYVYSTEGKIKEPNILAEAGQGALNAGMSYLRGDLGGVAKNLFGIGKQIMNGNSAEQKARATRTSPADAIQWSGCKDNQTSADATEAGKATGAMSWAYITALTEQPNQTYQQLLVSIRQLLSAKYSQKPQLSSSHPIDTSLMYVQ